MSKRNSGNNPEEKTDLRIRRTKKSIRDAFFELIDENGSYRPGADQPEYILFAL